VVEALRHVLLEDRFDLIHAVHPWLIRAVRDAVAQTGIHRPAVVGHVMDIGSQVFFQQAVRKTGLTRLLYMLKFGRMSLFEFEDYAYPNALLVHSPSEGEILRAYVPRVPKILFTPVWFDALSAIKETIDLKESCELLYVGNSHDPRMKEALTWFIDRVYPQIIAMYPGVKLNIVSVHPEHMHWWHKPPHVICHTPLSTEELLSLYDRSAALVFPLRQGRYSVHIKVLNAFALGCVVIMSSEANHSLQARHAVEALIADDPQEFATHIISILKDPALSQKIAAEALCKLRTMYPDVNAIADSLEAAYYQAFQEINPKR
jgi:glycosyltransferase involved in cell wall biosynthesis